MRAVGPTICCRGPLGCVQRGHFDFPGGNFFDIRMCRREGRRDGEERGGGNKSQIESRFFAAKILPSHIPRSFLTFFCISFLALAKRMSFPLSLTLHPRSSVTCILGSLPALGIGRDGASGQMPRKKVTMPQKISKSASPEDTSEGRGRRKQKEGWKKSAACSSLQNLPMKLCARR